MEHLQASEPQSLFYGQSLSAALRHWRGASQRSSQEHISWKAMRCEAFVACTVLRLHLRDLRAFACVDGVRGRVLLLCGILNAKNTPLYNRSSAIRGACADKRPGCVASGRRCSVGLILCSSHLNMVIM